MCRRTTCENSSGKTRVGRGPDCLFKSIASAITLWLALAAPASYAAVLQSFQYGDATIGATSTSTTVTINSITKNNSFLIFTTGTNSNQPRYFKIGGEITNGTTLTFRRNSSSMAVSIRWQVYEFSSGVTVQHGSKAIGATPADTNITLTAVNLAKAFPIVTNYSDGGTYGNSDCIRSELTTTTNLLLDRGGADAYTVYWQVVEYDNCTVQSIATNGWNTTSTTATIPVAVNTGKTMLVTSYNTSGTQYASYCPMVVLTNGTTLTYGRTTATTTLNMLVYAVEFTGSEAVTHGKREFVASDVEEEFTVSAVDLTTTGVFGTGLMFREGRSNHADDNTGANWYFCQFTNSTLLNISRAYGSATGTDSTAYQIVSFVGPTPGVWDGEGGGSYDWNTGTNWVGDGVPAAGSNLQFAGTTGLTNNNNIAAATSFASITFNSGAGAFTLGGTSITLTGPIINNDNDLQTINVAIAVAATNTFYATSGNITIGGVISGAGGLTKSGTATLTLSGTNSYTGATTVSKGTLAAGIATAAFGSNSAVIMVNTSSTSFDITGYSNTIGSLSGGGSTGGNVILGAATLTTGGNNTSTTYTGVVSGTGGITKTGSGTQTLSGTNTYTGATTVSVGTLKAGVATAAFGSGSAVTTANTASTSLDITGYNNTIGSLSGGGSTGGNVILGAATLMTGGNNTSTTYTGVVSGTGGLTKTGTGTFTLSGTSTYTGATTVSVGTLKAGIATAAFGSSSAVTTANTASTSLDITGYNNTIGSLSGGGATGGNVILGAVTLTTGGNNTSTTYTGVVSGTGGLTKTGTGTFTLSGTNTYTGATTVSVGTLKAGIATAAFGSGSAVTTANTASTSLDITGYNNTIGSLSGGGATGGNVILGAVTLTTGGNNTSTTYTGVVSGTGGLTKTGTGTFTLSGTNTYTGATTVSVGTLKAGIATAAFGSGSAVTTANTASTSLDITGYNNTIGSLSGGGSTGGNVILGAATLTAGGNNTSTTYTGVVSGTGGLTKTGTGTFTLSGTSTYTGATTVSVGTLKAGIATSAFGSASAVTIANVAGTTLDIAGFNTTIGSLSGTGTTTNGNVILDGNTLTTGGDNTSTAYSGIMSGAGGALTKTGSGTFTLSGTSTYDGATTISNGTLLVTGGTNASSAVGVSSGGTLAGTGTVAGAVTVSGGGTIVPGNGGAGTLRTGALTLGATSVLTYECAAPAGTSDKIVVTGAIALAGTINITSIGGFAAGTYTLMTYSTTVSGGLAIGTFPATFGGVISTGGGNVTLTVTDVITPSWTATSLGAVNGGAISHLALYIGTGSGATGALRCLNLSTGATTWSYSTNTDPCRMPTYVWNGSNYKIIATAGSNLVGVLDDGNQLWAPCALGGTAGNPYVTPDDGNICVIAGTTLTRRSLANPTSVSLTQTCTNVSVGADMVVMNDEVYVASTDGRVTKVDYDGTPISIWDGAGGKSIDLPLLAATVADSLLYVFPKDRMAYAIKTSTMTTSGTWTYLAADENCGPAFMSFDGKVRSGVIYCAAGAKIYKLTEGSAAETWAYTIPGGRVCQSGPVEYNGKIYFGTTDSSYFAITDAPALISKWPYPASSGNANSGPWIDPMTGKIYFGTTGGRVDAFPLQ